MSLVALLVGAAWAALVVLAARRHRPPRLRTAALLPGRVRPPLLARRDPVWRAVPGLMCGSVGRVILRRSRRSEDEPVARRVGAAVLTTVPVAAVLPIAAPVVAAAWFVVPWWRRRRDGRRATSAVIDALPDLADLFQLAAASGLSVRLAVEEVALRFPGDLGTRLGEVIQLVSVGRRLVDALDVLRELGEPVRPLVDALQASERYGVPLTPSLERVAAEARRRRRRLAEETARRVPVALLFPLVLCTLPAFGLLTVVPLLAGAFSNIRL